MNNEMILFKNRPVFFTKLFITQDKIINTYVFAQIFVLLSALFALNIGRSFASNRTYVILGGLFACSAYLISAVIPDVSYLILSLGVLFGKFFLSVIFVTDKNFMTPPLQKKKKKKKKTQRKCIISLSVSVFVKRNYLKTLALWCFFSRIFRTM